MSLKINCLHADGSTCKANRFPHATIAVCGGLCRHREPIDASKPAVYATLTIGGIARGAIGLTKAAIGADPAPPDVVAARRAICEQCEYRKGSRCLLCGCFTQPKTALLGSTCPASRW